MLWPYSLCFLHRFLLLLRTETRVCISKSHSPNAARSSHALSSLHSKAGEHGSSMNFYLLAGLKHLPYRLQSWLWFTSVHTRMYLPLGETWGFPGQPLVEECSEGLCLSTFPAASPQTNANLSSVKHSMCCVGTVQQEEKGGRGCVCATLALPSGKTGQSPSIRWMQVCFQRLSCSTRGSTTGVLAAETLYLFLHEVTPLKIRC